MTDLHTMNEKLCSCGKVHSFFSQIISGKGALEQLPACLTQRGAKRAFILSDVNTHAAAAEKVCSLLQAAGIAFVDYCMEDTHPEPDEKSVGSAMMHFDASCDIIIGVGSGVINDIGKIVSNVSGKPYMIVATAPSMDGYASASSSMTRDGLKISLPSRSADVIIGDTDILCQAPLDMMRSGLGDMVAKYISICEWRIAHLLTGEYYCEQIAQLIRRAVKRCADNAQGLLQRREEAVMAVFEGLVIGGVAMNYAGLSRPASGVEHYISHVLDMRGVEFGTPVQSHGMQCAAGTYIAAQLYEKLCRHQPDAQAALDYVKNFDYDLWSGQLEMFLGKGAKSMIQLEKTEGKYDKAAHEKRLERIVALWPQILQIVREEIPPLSQLDALYDAAGLPKTLGALGVEDKLLPMVFQCTKDIRDKYVLSRLAWDLGMPEDIMKME